METHSNRLKNLRKLVEQWGGPLHFSQKLGYSNASFIVQMAGPNPSRVVSERTARRIEEVLGLPRGWLDAPDQAVSAPAVDTDLVTASIRAVAQVAESAGVSFGPVKFGDLVTMAYLDAVEHGAPRVRYIEQLVKLAT